MFLPKKIEKWPSKAQWKYFFKVFTRKEIFFLIFFVILSISSAIFVVSKFYYNNTRAIPAEGGIYIEGVLGQPRFLNPIYANSDADRDISQLIYSGLVKYNEKFEIVPDLAQNYEILNEGKTYKFYLKENLVWEDKTPITADDVVFTIKTIQNPDYKSPFRATWVGVEVEKINDLSVKFTLKKPYSSFLENCAVKIMPKHIWQDVAAERFAFDSRNLKPIGSGPYRIKDIKQEKDEYITYLTLKKNTNYYGQKPFINEIKFSFYDNEKDLFRSAQQGKIKGLSLSSYINPDKRWNNYDILMPRYFALFLNLEKVKIFEEKDVRVALNYATDKKAIVKTALNLNEDSPLIQKSIVDSPVLPSIFGLANPSKVYEFNQETAKKLLDTAGYKDNNNDGIREKSINKKSAFQLKKELKLNSSGTEVEQLQKCLAKFPDIYPDGDATGTYGQKTADAITKFQEKYKDEILTPSGLDKGNGIVGVGTRKKLNELCFGNASEVSELKFTITTVDQPQMQAVAEEIKKQWKNIGVEVEIKKVDISQLEQDYIKPRDYDILLFGEVLGLYPDLHPFWHSSQTKDPGLNLSGYANKDADRIMEDIRSTSDLNSRKLKLAALGDTITEDAPAVFLYCPDFFYMVSKTVKNIETEKIVDPSKRFSGIENWYMEEKRIWK